MNRIKQLMASLKARNIDYSISAALLVAGVVLACLNPQYRNINNYMNILREASFVGIAALGMMNVIITRNTDLSVGTMMALTAVAMLKLMPLIGMIPALLVGLILAVSLGTLNGFFVVYVRIFAFILTLGMQYIFKGVAHIITNQKIVGATDAVFTQIGNLNLFPGNGFEGIPLPFVLFIVIAAAFYILLNRTGFGRKIYAVGNSDKAAELSGINANCVRLLAYSLLGLCVGISAVLVSSRLWMASAEMRPSYEFDVITIVVMGGCVFNSGRGSVVNTVVSSIFFATIYNIINQFNVDPYWQYIIRAGLLALAFSVSTIRQHVSAKLGRYGNHGRLSKAEN